MLVNLQTRISTVASSHTFLEFIRYGIAGVINTVVSFGAYSFCILILTCAFWIANFAAVIAGVICGYFLAKKFVFTKSEGIQTSQSGPRYLITIGLQYVVTTLIIWAFVNQGAGEIISYVVSLPIAMLLSFSLQKLWVFPNKIDQS